MPRAAKAASASNSTAAVPYFRPRRSPFLRNLARHNDREWFTPRKAEFEAELKEPMLALVRKITDAMMDFAPNHIRPAEKSLFVSIATRASPATSVPTKLTSPHGGRIRASTRPPARATTSTSAPRKSSSRPAPTCRRRINWPPSATGFSTTTRVSETSSKSPHCAKAFTEFEGNALTRPPKGFPCDHPALDLIQHRQWGLSAALPASAALKPDIAATVIRHFKLAAPVVDALNTPIAAALAPKKKVLFGLH